MSGLATALAASAVALIAAGATLSRDEILALILALAAWLAFEAIVAEFRQFKPELETHLGKLGLRLGALPFLPVDESRRGDASALFRRDCA